MRAWEASGGLMLALMLMTAGGVDAIAGGTEAAPGDFPSIAVVFYTFEMFPPGEQRRVFCGGTLVAPSAVLVAGHCVADGAADMLSGVKIGTTDLKDPAAPERNISRFVLHPQYRNSQADFDLDAPPRLDNDVALIILDEPVDGVPLQRLAGPNATEPAPGERLWVAGWGKLPGDTPLTPNPPRLLATELEAVSLEECRDWFSAYNQSGLIDPDGADLCAGSSAANSTCSGDSGGPLLALDGTQLGITSHGLYGGLSRDGQPGGCGSTDKLTAFASVAHFRAWIDQVLEQEGLTAAA